MILLAFLQVIVRNFFDTGLLWAEAIVRLLVLWVGFLGAMLATKKGQHICMDVFTKFMGETSRTLVGILMKILAAVVCLFILKAAWTFVLSERESGSEFFKNVPYWWVEIIIPTAFLLIPFHFLVAVLNDFRSLLKKPVDQ